MTDWYIAVTESLDPSNQTDIIRFFLLPEQTSLASIDKDAHTVNIEVENGTDLSSLSPTFLLSRGATSSPENGTTGDYSNPVTITVTAEDGKTIQDWAVTVTEASPGLSSQTDILTFSFEEETGEATPNPDNHTIDIEVENGTDRSSITPTFLLSSGATSVPPSGTEGDYSHPVSITVTAEDGTIQDWTVTVTKQASDATDILSFSFTEETGDAVRDTAAHTVTIEVANRTDLTNLTPTFTLSPGANSVPVSGTAGDYSSPLHITVTAEDGTTIQHWTVIVTEHFSDATDIRIFLLAEQTSLADIDTINHTVSIEVVNGTDRSDLTPTFLLSQGATSVPPSGSARDFSGPVPVNIRVTAEDATIQNWAVTVTEAPPGQSSHTDILTFSFLEETGEANPNPDNHTIDIEVVN